MSTAKQIASRILQAVLATVEPGATECPDCGGELESGFKAGGDLLCGTCYRTWSYPRTAAVGDFRKGDRVRRKSDGMEGEVFYVGSGPKGDRVSVYWDNPAQRILGPDIVSPGSVEKI